MIASFLLFSSIGLNADAKKIKILGNERVSDETIILLSGLSGSAKISSDDINEALKKITRSGLFSNVKIDHQNEFIAIEVNENPVISEVVFEGNKVVSSEDLSAIIRSSSSNAYSKETVVADTKSLADFYKSKGRFNAVITPQYINSEESYIKLVFNINEGDLLEVEEIIFIGNSDFYLFKIRNARFCTLRGTRALSLVILDSRRFLSVEVSRWVGPCTMGESRLTLYI